MGLADRAYLKRDYMSTRGRSFKPPSKRESEVYNSDVGEYNKSVEVSEMELDGRTAISDPIEYANLNLNTIEKTGFAINDELCLYRWMSFGLVTGVEVYW
ncbi:MAG: hypothetical protein LAKADJCE_00399 [Candidatus Argoarchaeum ethanivorans]|uniref:Uncharacterized protein n=1 Tax=Candidatus Argoarchaeum ethanivorans TaxID=2608793 RepID=A0A811TBE5_9EURY|nr:MAG: hypothetical protein LAKADJCE_00399 [Candidatus Argoarchaeum ethanivorans]